MRRYKKKSLGFNSIRTEKALTCAIFCLYLSVVSGTPASADCGLTKVTQMPLVRLGKHYAVAVRVGDDIRPMIVDTGAAVTTINLSAVEELQLKRDPSPAHVHRVLGVGQTTAEVYQNVIPSILAFGDLAYRERSTAVSKMNFGEAPEQDAIGLLGDDILSQFDVEFDFPAGKLTFYRASGCYETFIPWSGHYSTTPFLHVDSKLVIDVILNDERDQAIVDTGNAFSFVSRRLLAHWRVADSEFSKPVGKIGSPLNDGTSYALKLFTFKVVKIGYDAFPLIKMGVADVDFPLASVNLGLDFWQSRKIWISYPNKWMFLAAKGATKLAYPVRAAEGKDTDAK